MNERSSATLTPTRSSSASRHAVEALRTMDDELLQNSEKRLYLNARGLVLKHVYEPNLNRQILNRIGAQIENVKLWLWAYQPPQSRMKSLTASPPIVMAGAVAIHTPGNYETNHQMNFVQADEDELRNTISHLPLERIALISRLIRERVPSVEESAQTTERMPNDFVSKAIRFDTDERVDYALDILYDGIDDLMSRGDFDELDDILASISIEGRTVEFLVGVLVATLPGWSELANRKNFFERVSSELGSRGENDPTLLFGLDR